MFALLFLASYYYSILALIPLMLVRDRYVPIVVALFMILAIITGWNTFGVMDLRFLVYSIEIFLLLGALAVWVPIVRPRDERAAAEPAAEPANAEA